MFRLLPSFVFAALAGLLALGADAREFVVGQVVDYGGKHGEASRDYVAGAKIYFDALNARGGLGGARIRHVVLDAPGGAEDLRVKLRELLGERKADVLFGIVGDESVEALEPTLRENAVALVAPLAGRDAPSSIAPRTFFTRPGYPAEVRQIVSHFRALQLTRFAVVKAADAAWVGEVVERSLAEHGIKPMGSRTLTGSLENDVAAALAMKAQAIVVVADTVDTAEFIKRYRPRDPGAMVVALSTVNHHAMFELLGPRLAHGVLITQVVPNPLIADTPLLKEHADTLKIFRDEPPSHLTLEGFVAAKVLVEGLRRAGKDPTREGIVAAFQQMKRLDLKGLVVDLTPRGRSDASQVDLAMIRRNGNLLQ